LTKNNYVLSAENRKAMQWINESTPIGSQFLLLTGESNSGQDEVQEWFPALTGRISLTTIQGKEWQPGNLFAQAEEETKQLQLDCLTASVACIKDWVEKNRIEYEYIYVVDKSNNPYGLPIVNSLSSSNDYSLVYTSPEKEVLIYQSKNR
jgi:hypothetical protein